MSGVYAKIVEAVENNGGVIVAFENCEALKPAIRHFDIENPDIYEAFANCYQKTACAIMSPNEVRFNLIRELVEDYKVDGNTFLMKDSTGAEFIVECTVDDRFNFAQFTDRIP